MVINNESAANVAANEQNVNAAAQSSNAANLAANVYSNAANVNRTPASNNRAGVPVRTQYCLLGAAHMHWRPCKNKENGMASTRAIVSFLDEDNSVLDWYTASEAVTNELKALKQKSFPTADAEKAAMRALLFSKNIFETTSSDGESYLVIGNTINLSVGDFC